MPNALRTVFALLLLATLMAGGSAFAQQQAATIVLVAKPELRDPMFKESVVLVTRHGQSRPMGVILNKPVSPTTERGDPARSRPLFRGGPVAPRSLVSLFRDADNAERNVLDLGEGVYLGFGHALLEKRLKQEGELKVFLGFSAWDYGQLEREISRGDWWIVPFEVDMAFRMDAAELWRELTARASRKDT